ncbi:hypothetical protein ACTXT7_000895 [Hymenolepis weldensis]
MEFLRDHNHKSDNSELDPLQRDSDDSSSTIITPETELDIEHLHTSNREHSEELPSIAIHSNSVQGEKQCCSPEHVPAIHKRRAK